MPSPYDGATAEAWSGITTALLDKHPLKAKEVIEIVQEAWTSIFNSKFGHAGYTIGKDIFPKPQIIGFLMHELLTLETARRYPKLWRGELAASDKDLVYIPDDSFSIELKTSSHPNQIFGNRSYAQGVTSGKKAKSGYYICVNFEACAPGAKPKVRVIHYGWIDSTDWIGQAAATGQQSRLPPAVYGGKLLKIYKA